MKSAVEGVRVPARAARARKRTVQQPAPVGGDGGVVADASVQMAASMPVVSSMDAAVGEGAASATNVVAHTESGISGHGLRVAEALANAAMCLPEGGEASGAAEEWAVGAVAPPQQCADAVSEMASSVFEGTAVSFVAETPVRIPWRTAANAVGHAAFSADAGVAGETVENAAACLLEERAESAAANRQKRADALAEGAVSGFEEVAVGAAAETAARIPWRTVASTPVRAETPVEMPGEQVTERASRVFEDTVPKVAIGSVVQAAALSIGKDAVQRAATYVTVVRTVGGMALGWLRRQHVQRTSGRRLRVIETVSLGEKRFAALLAVDGAEFLIGGSGSSVALLASVDHDAANGFRHALQQAGAERQQ